MGLTDAERRRRKQLERQGFTGRSSRELDLLNRKLTDGLSNDQIRTEIQLRRSQGKPTGQLEAAARKRGISID
jgi:hypothetical protein